MHTLKFHCQNIFGHHFCHIVKMDERSNIWLIWFVSRIIISLENECWLYGPDQKTDTISNVY